MTADNADGGEAARSLLLVDDDKIWLQRLATAMDRRGFDVTMAASVREATELAHKVAPDYAVVDLRLEDGSGLDVVGILRGSDAKLTNEYVVFSSHLDHIGTEESDEEDDTIYNGFYDNAVGVAIMLESARALSKLTVAPRRSIIFIAVTGEEAGLPSKYK